MDFRFLKFFGVSAPMAVLMGPSKYQSILNVQSSIGGKMLNSLKIELEALKKFLIDDLEFIQVNDTENKIYKDFVRGLKVYLNSKAEETPASVKSGAGVIESNVDEIDFDEPLFDFEDEPLNSGTAGRADTTSSFADAISAKLDDSPDLEPSAGNESKLDNQNDLDLEGGLFSVDDSIADDSLDFDGGLFSMNGIENPEEDLIPGDLVAFEEISLVNLGHSSEDPVSCVVTLNTHAQLILFIARLGDGKKFNLSQDEVDMIHRQYEQLPKNFTGKVKLMTENRIINLEDEDPILFHILLTLRNKAVDDFEGRALIDWMINVTKGTVDNCNVDTKKFLGQNYNILLVCKPCTIQQRMMETIGAESKEGRLNKINLYIRDCQELLTPTNIQNDSNLISICKIKTEGLTLSESLDSVLPKLRNSQLSELMSGSKESLFVAFVQECCSSGQFVSVFSSYKSVVKLFEIYSEVCNWDNKQWMSALGLVTTTNPEQIGTKLTIGGNVTRFVAEDFSIDEYSEKLMSFNVVGVTTSSHFNFSSCLKIVGKLDQRENYYIDKSTKPEVYRILVSAFLQLKSMQYRIQNSITTLIGPSEI